MVLLYQKCLQVLLECQDLKLKNGKFIQSKILKIKEYLWKFNFYSFALGFVFFAFGVWQILSLGYWSAYLPKSFSFLGPVKFFIINGIFNFVVGFALIFNFYPLIFSLLAIFHLLGVISVIGIFNDIAIRGLGLLFLAVGIFINSLKEKIFYLNQIML